MFKRGRRQAYLSDPAQPVVDQATLEDPLYDQVSRFRVRRVFDEAQPDVELAYARPSRPQVVQQRRRYRLRFHEVFPVQTLG